MIVDDDADDRRAVIHALRQDAMEIDGVEADVLEASTIAQAREALQHEEFACIFLDHNLPDESALGLLVEVRSQGLATPVVVLTGERDEQSAVEVMQAGAMDYLPKAKLHPDIVARSLRAALRVLRVQREKQAVLMELRARDRAIAAAFNGIVIADPRLPDCPLVYTNAAFLRMTGYTEEEVLGRNCRFLQGPGTDPAVVRELREAIRQERGCQVLIRNYRKDRTTFWNEITVSPVRDTRGALTHFVGIQTDTTARQEADGERATLLRTATRQAAELAAVLEQMPAGVCLGTADGISLSNKVGLEMMGVSSAAELPQSVSTLSELIQTRWADTGKHILPEEEVFSRALRGERVMREVRLRNMRTGTDMVVQSAAAPIVEQGRIVGAVAVNTDVTHLKKIEEALRQFQFIADHAADAFFLMDKEGHFVFSNAAACRALGYTAEDLLGLRVPDIDPLHQDEQYHALFQKATEERIPPFETLHRRADGTTFPVEASVSLLEIDDRKLLFCSIRDITVRKRQEAEMAALYEREHRIAEALQRSLLNKPAKRADGLDLEMIYRPAWDEAQVGGDYFDVFPLDGDQLALVVGDVSGKGLQAASRTAEVKYTLRAYLREFASAAPALERLNDFLCEAQAMGDDDQEYFVVLTIAVVNTATGEAHIVVAGGDPPLILRARGTVEEVQASGMPLSIAAKVEYKATDVQLEMGDLFLITTDGLTEARRGREFLGNEGLARLAQQTQSLGSLAEIGQAILAGAQEFASGPLHDDVCLLLARRR